MRQAPPIMTTMAGQVYSTHEDILEKRGPKGVLVKNFYNRDVLTCHLPQGGYATIPAWPGPKAVTQIENKDPGARNADERVIIASMKRWYIGKQDKDNLLPYLALVDTSGLKDGGPQGEQVFVPDGSIGKKPEVTIDHICMFTSTCYIEFLLC
jgi:hypothetical protein